MKKSKYFLLIGFAWSLSFFIAKSQPIIGNFSPSSGLVGSIVTITGSGFSPINSQNKVYFGATKAIVNSATSNSLTVTVPFGSTYNPITVQTNNLTAYSSKPFIPIFTCGAGVFSAGSFAPQLTLPVNHFPQFVTAGDLDGDGKPDLMVANNFGNNISLFRNTSGIGNILFAPRIDVGANPMGNPYSVDFGDIDGDGKPDMVVANNNASAIAVHRNTSTPGNFSFDAELSFATIFNTHPQSVSIGDMDGDGKPDVVSVSFYGTVDVFRNTSTPGVVSFASAQSVNTGGAQITSLNSVFLRDIDGDGKVELVCGGFSTGFGMHGPYGYGNITVFKNICSIGTLSFASPKSNILTGACNGIGVGDFDGDGKPDLVGTSIGTDSISLFKNISTPGNLIIGTAQNIKAGESPYGLSLNDLNGDGKVDIAITNLKAGVGSVGLFKNTSTIGTFSFDAMVEYPTGQNPVVMAISDLDGDGKPDITTANKLSDDISILQNLMSCSGGVGGGGGGGLESRSLGDAVGKRLYNAAIENRSEKINYNSLTQLTEINKQIRSTSSNTAFTLAELLPTHLPDTKLKAYISTPKDLMGITNAKEVYSIDYVEDNLPKAVAFATKTTNEVYDHTKAVCDRLKGAELLSIKKMVVQGMSVIRYDLKTASGNIEYASSFVIGSKSGRNYFTLQSNWLNQDYLPEETMYNIQLWGGSVSILTDLIDEVISKCKQVLVVQQVGSNSLLPKTYITLGKRKNDLIELNINNEGPATSGYFIIEEKANEQSTLTVNKTVAFTIETNGKSIIQIPVSDNYEATINLNVNGILKDQVFTADGNWGIDYNTNTTIIKQFKVSNSKVLFDKDDFPLFRDVNINATTPDFISIYKLLRGGAMPQDLSGYKSLNLTAAGGNTLTITLLKQSITKWEDQYSLQLPTSLASKDYRIALDYFVSAANKNSKLNPNDITAMVISIGSGNSQRKEITNSISHVSFSKVDIAYLQSLELKDIAVYPNPNKGKFTSKFKADKNYEVTIKITEVSNGKAVFSKTINTIIGDNNIDIDISRKINGSGTYIVSIEGDTVKYKPKMLIVQ